MISIASGTLGALTMTGWKRRSRAPSFSMYLRYSSSVVAPIVWISPRDSAGLSMLEASMAPSAAPGQDLDDALDLLLAADHRVELGLAGQLGEIAGELVEHRRLRALLRTRVVLVAQQRQRLLADLVEPRAERLQDLGGDRLAFLH